MRSPGEMAKIKTRGTPPIGATLTYRGRWICITHLECINVIREDDYLIPSLLVILYEELAGLELLWIHAVQQHPLPGLLSQVFAVKFRSHGAPHFRALFGHSNGISEDPGTACEFKFHLQTRLRLTWTFAICPLAARSIQFASYSLGPII